MSDTKANEMLHSGKIAELILRIVVLGCYGLKYEKPPGGVNPCSANDLKDWRESAIAKYQCRSHHWRSMPDYDDTFFHMAVDQITNSILTVIHDPEKAITAYEEAIK